MRRSLLLFFFGFFISLFVVPQFNYTFAETCEDPDFGNCINPGNVCPLGGVDAGVCDDAGNKNYACIKLSGEILFRCRVRWECTCASAGSSSTINCTSKAFNSSTSSTKSVNCRPNQVCKPDPTSRIEFGAVQNNAELFAGVECVAGSSSGAGSGQRPPEPPAPPCAVDPKTTGGKCLSVITAFGPVATNPEQFITRFFGILLAASGAMAILLIMRAGYQIMTARGNAEGIQHGRERLVAAIVGLMFLIFSFVLLQVIGVDLLRLPTFR